MYADLNEDIAMKIIISVGEWGKKEQLESPRRLVLICYKTFELNLI